VTFLAINVYALWFTCLGASRVLGFQYLDFDRTTWLNIIPETHRAHYIRYLFLLVYIDPEHSKF